MSGLSSAPDDHCKTIWDFRPLLTPHNCPAADCGGSHRFAWEQLAHEVVIDRKLCPTGRWWLASEVEC